MSEQMIEVPQDPNRALAIADKELTVPDLYMVIQEPYNSSKLIDRSIGFNAKSVVINNLSGQWFYAPFLATWIPPFIIGMTKNIPGGTQKASIVTETPVGQTSSPTANQYVTLNFYSINLSPDPGILLPSAASIAGSMIAKGEYLAAPPALADTNVVPLKLDARGNMKVSLWSPGSATQIGALSGAADANSGGGTAYTVAPYSLVFNGGTWDRMRAMNALVGNASQLGLLGVGLLSLDGTTGFNRQTKVASLDSMANADGPLAIGGMLFNGTTFDRPRNNIEATLLASAARTATVQSADQINYNGRGVEVIINVTAIAATPSVVFTIQGKDPISGTYYPILASAAIVGTGLTRLRVKPGITPAANLAVADNLPRTWRIEAVHADADSITYSVAGVTTL